MSTVNKVLASLAGTGACVGAVATIKKSGKITAEVTKESLGGTHASPTMHRVRGYVRKNGTKVSSYIRGVKK